MRRIRICVAQQVAHAKQQAGALFAGSPAPALKRVKGGLHGRFDMVFAGFLVQADNLRRLGGIDGLDLVRGLDALAADDEVILASELGAHFFDGGAHLAGIFFLAEINQRLVDERAFM